MVSHTSGSRPPRKINTTPPEEAIPGARRASPASPYIESPITRRTYQRTLHRRDLETGYGEVFLPYALEHKYPRAPREWSWQ
jgi:hypothetical protein